MKGARNSDRVWLGGGALLALMVLLVAWFAVISPELTATGDITDQTVAAQTQNTVAQTKLTKLRSDFANMPTLTATLRQAREALPSGSGLPDFTRQLTTEAATAGVTMKSLTTSTPVLATSPNAAATAAAQAAATPAAGGASSAAGVLLAIPVTVVVEGSLEGHRALLRAVQVDGPRRALLTSVVVAPATGAATASVTAATTMTMQLQVFVAPLSPADEAALSQLNSPG